MRSLQATFILIALFSFDAFAERHDFAIIGDAGKANENAMQVRDSIIKAGVQKLILPGDNLYETKKGYAQAWNPWSEKGLTFDVVAIGNHNAGYSKEIKFFKMPYEYYVKKYGSDVKFIVLNSDNQFFPKMQARWFEKELKNTNEKFVFIVYHHPSLTLQHKWKDRKIFAEQIRPLLAKYRSKITAVLVGHDHLAAQYHFDNLPVILSGAVQEQRTPSLSNNVQEGITVRTDYMYDGSPFWVRLNVDDQKEFAQFEFIGAKDNKVAFTSCVKTGSEAKACLNSKN